MLYFNLINGQLMAVIAPIIVIFSIAVLSDHIVDAIKRVMRV